MCAQAKRERTVIQNGFEIRDEGIHRASFGVKQASKRTKEHGSQHLVLVQEGYDKAKLQDEDCFVLSSKSSGLPWNHWQKDDWFHRSQIRMDREKSLSMCKEHIREGNTTLKSKKMEIDRCQSTAPKRRFHFKSIPREAWTFARHLHAMRSRVIMRLAHFLTPLDIIHTRDCRCFYDSQARSFPGELRWGNWTHRANAW